ncbi:hypothetical protein AB1K81_00045 [Ornithinibacillus sp. 179-J 7C1 HS]
MKDYGIPESALDLLAKDGSKQRRLLDRSPLQLDIKDIRKIY